MKGALSFLSEEDKEWVNHNGGQRPCRILAFAHAILGIGNSRDRHFPHLGSPRPSDSNSTKAGARSRFGSRLITILPRKGILVSDINPRNQLLLLEVRRRCPSRRDQLRGAGHHRRRSCRADRRGFARYGECADDRAEEVGEAAYRCLSKRTARPWATSPPMRSSCGSRGATPWSTRFRRRRSPATIANADEPATNGSPNTLGSRHERDRPPVRARRRSVPGRGQP